MSGGLVRLEAPFDIEAFSRQLGETRIQIDVPREDLAEVLRRVSEFMSFGIYVYELSFRPVPGEQLKQFRVALNRVDYAGPEKGWVPFEDRGRSDTPFGPGRTGVR